MAARLSALRAGRTLPPGFFSFKDSWYSFLLEAESTPHLEKIGKETLHILSYVCLMDHILLVS
jgi:hypothetical protein